MRTEAIECTVDGKVIAIGPRDTLILRHKGTGLERTFTYGDLIALGKGHFNAERIFGIQIKALEGANHD